ncbi:hypothetical protein ACFZC5_17460 [Nocardia gamkensis]|uniref:hypothetical protein n=1 Tax=Nocardia gamkensis TaxID=352869 RepID=UPI0036E10326
MTTPIGAQRIRTRTSTAAAELTVAELVGLREIAPEICKLLLEQKKLDQRHRRRIAWATQIAQAVGHTSGLAALGIWRWWRGTRSMWGHPRRGRRLSGQVRCRSWRCS